MCFSNLVGLEANTIHPEAFLILSNFVHDKNLINMTSVIFLSFRPTGEILNFSGLRFLTIVRNDTEYFLSCTEIK